jgi:Outer membrane protein beta-barrel domain
MYRISLFICILLFNISLKAIDFKLGLMGGANSSLNQLYTYDVISKTDPKLGYNANLFGRLKFSSYIIQPEFGYMMNRVGFSVLENGSIKESNFELGQMYTAILMGIKFSKIRFSVGPMLAFTSNQSFDALTSKETVIKQINEDRANLGAMADIGIDISKRWSVDLRASRTFTQSEFNTVIQNKSFNFSGNTGMISIMLGYTILKTK